MSEATTLRATSSPLRWDTPPSWVAQVAADLPTLLNDHAHLERKAATNALELLNRWPWPTQVHGEDEQSQRTDHWSRALTSIASDEVRHLGQVLRLLRIHGGHLERTHVNPYAGDLRRLVRMGQGARELVDRLLVSALIEARSLERFLLLGDHLPDSQLPDSQLPDGPPPNGHASGAELRRFYQSLVASERGHYRAFLDLAGQVPAGGESLEERWDELLEQEAEIIRQQAPGCRIHAGVEA